MYLQKLSRWINVFVFIAASLAVGGVLYEGLTLQWYPVVGLFIVVMDYSFLASVLLNIFVERTTKWLKVNVFLLILLVIAIGMKLAGIDYSPISLEMWYLYIWIIYGIKTIFVLGHKKMLKTYMNMQRIRT